MKFYDTSSLLLLKELDEEIAISSITLKELENIKSSFNKDYNVKAAARRVVNMLNNNPEKHKVVIFQNKFLEPLEEADLLINDDMRILGCALNSGCDIFVSNDNCLRIIASMFFEKVEKVEIADDNYLGYKEVVLNDIEMANFYSNLANNSFELHINEYVNIYNLNNELVDTLKWNGERHENLSFHNFNSIWLGQIKPMDAYQRMLCDSLCHNQLTMVGGPAGSGKTYLTLGYLFDQLDKNKIDKIVIFVNPVAARDTARLGFYPGTMLEKVLSTQAGHTLSSKLGGIEEVERLIADHMLEIIPAVDARGYQAPPHCAIYMLEAQNLTSDTLRMLLQRCSEDTKIIIDGDRLEQLDIDAARNDNGMKKASEVFRGSELFGQVDLKAIRRSKIAALAELMK